MPGCVYLLVTDPMRDGSHGMFCVCVCVCVCVWWGGVGVSATQLSCIYGLYLKVHTYCLFEWHGVGIL